MGVLQTRLDHYHHALHVLSGFKYMYHCIAGDLVNYLHYSVIAQTSVFQCKIDTPTLYEIHWLPMDKSDSNSYNTQTQRFARTRHEQKKQQIIFHTYF